MNIVPYILHVEQPRKAHQLSNQDWCLRHILNKNRNTYLGQQYQFKDIKTYDDFRQLPLTRYDHYETLVQKVLKGEPHTLFTKDKVIAFMKTSGTTSEGKLIPMTHRFIHKNHYYGSRTLMYNLVKNYDFNDYLTARNLSLSGYRYRFENGYDVIDMSALLIKHLPFYMWGMNFPNEVFTTWEDKLEYIVDHLESLKAVRVMLGVPTWILSFLNYLTERTGKSIPELFPNWQVYLHGGVNFNPYRDLFNNMIDRQMIFLEVYNATEGFFAFQDLPKSEGLLLLTGGRIFYEFIPFGNNVDTNNYQNTILPLRDVEVGRDYLMVITTEYGLYRYIMGDVIRFVSVNPYRLKVVGRESEYINAFGENLSMFHVNNALKDLSKQMDFTIRDFTISPKYATEIKANGCHEWLIEFINEPTDINSFINGLDELLQRYNNNYEQKRRSNIIQKLTIITLKTGTYEKHLRKNKIIGGQAKMKKLFNDRVVAEQILNVV